MHQEISAVQDWGKASWDGQNRLIFAEGVPLLANPKSGHWVRLSPAGCQLYECLAAGRESAAPPLASADLTRPRVHAFMRQMVDGGFACLEGSGDGNLAGDPVPAPTRRSGNTPVADPASTLVSVTVNVTSRCNLACLHCAAADGNGHGNRPAEASTDEILKIIDLLSSEGVSRLVLYGGEPLIRRDIVSIIRHATARVPFVGLATNGTLLTPGLCRVISECASEVQISLDGSCPEIHDRIRGRNAFIRTVEGIRALTAAGFRKIRLKAVIHRLNADDAPYLVKLAHDLGVQLQCGTFVAMGRGCASQEELSLGSDHLLRTFLRIWVAAERFSLESASFNSSCSRWLAKASGNCGAGSSCLFVDESGDVYPCEGFPQAQFKMGNLIKGGANCLRTVMNGRFRTVDELASCSSCIVRYFCAGGCMAQAFQSGSLNEPSKCLCEFFRLVLPKIMARWEPRSGSMDNLFRVFGEATVKTSVTELELLRS